MNTSIHLPVNHSFNRAGAGHLFEEAWYCLGRESVKGISPLLFDLDIACHASIPTGAKLLCANHPSTIDPVMLTTLVPEPVRILISETLFKVPVLGPSLAASGHIRVVHANGRSALEEGLRCLANGQSVGIFPEGAISPVDGTLARVHTGAARMALVSGVPVIPVGIALKQANMLRVKTVVDGRVEVGTWYLHGPYALTIGAPMAFSGDVNDYARVQEVTCQIASRIAELSQESSQRLAAKTPQKALVQREARASLQPGVANLYEIAEPFFKWMRLVFVRS